MPSCWTAARALAEVKRRGQPSACAARVDRRAAAEQCASRGPPPPPPPPPPPWQPSMRASCGVLYRRFVEAKKMMSTPDGCLRLLDLIYGPDKGPPIVFDSSSDSPLNKRRYRAQPTRWATGPRNRELRCVHAPRRRSAYVQRNLRSRGPWPRFPVFFSLSVKPKQKAKPKHKPQAGTQGKSVSLIQDTP